MPGWQELLIVVFSVGILFPFLFLAVLYSCVYMERVCARERERARAREREREIEMLVVVFSVGVLFTFSSWRSMCINT
jgi:hypothetical protein